MDGSVPGIENAHLRGPDRHGYPLEKMPPVRIHDGHFEVPRRGTRLPTGFPRRFPLAVTPLLAQRAEARAHFLGQELRLLEGGEVPAFGEPVVVNQVRIGLFGPTPRGRIEFVWEDAHGSRDGNAF